MTIKDLVAILSVIPDQNLTVCYELDSEQYGITRVTVIVIPEADMEQRVELA